MEAPLFVPARGRRHSCLLDTKNSRSQLPEPHPYRNGKRPPPPLNQSLLLQVQTLIPIMSMTWLTVEWRVRIPTPQYKLGEMYSILVFPQIPAWRDSEFVGRSIREYSIETMCQLSQLSRLDCSRVRLPQPSTSSFARYFRTTSCRFVP